MGLSQPPVADGGKKQEELQQWAVLLPNGIQNMDVSISVSPQTWQAVEENCD